MRPSNDGSIFAPDESPRHREALEFAVKSVARVLGREDEYEKFIKSREMAIKALNDPNVPHSQERIEEFVKSIPYWIKALESPLNRLYEAGLKDGRFTKLREPPSNKEDH